MDLIQRGAEALLNGAVIDPLNDFVENLPWPLSSSGRPFPRACWPTEYDPVRCSGGQVTPEQQLAHAQCEDTSYGLENMCFYARVRILPLAHIEPKHFNTCSPLCAHRSATSVPTTTC